MPALADRLESASRRRMEAKRRLDPFYHAAVQREIFDLLQEAELAAGHLKLRDEYERLWVRPLGTHGGDMLCAIASWLRAHL